MLLILCHYGDHTRFYFYLLTIYNNNMIAVKNFHLFRNQNCVWMFILSFSYAPILSERIMKNCYWFHHGDLLPKLLSTTFALDQISEFVQIEKFVILLRAKYMKCMWRHTLSLEGLSFFALHSHLSHFTYFKLFILKSTYMHQFDRWNSKLKETFYILNSLNAHTAVKQQI
jgi:hypothetical protein